MKKNKRKIIVALSGGVDSAVSAALLKQKGEEVIAVFMKNINAEALNLPADECPVVADQFSARQVARHLNIPFYVVNFEKEYQKHVLDYFFSQYQAGQTPNPDVLCNTYIKFGALLDFAKNIGAEFIATGHYARLRREITNHKLQITNYYLLRGKDKNKDQSYFLWQLSQEQLKHIIFPIGDLTKPVVRRLAKKFQLPNAERKDSQGLCFIGQISVNNFLKTKIKPKKGKVVLAAGTIIGEHEGIWFYTIGQRHGWREITNSKLQIPNKSQILRQRRIRLWRKNSKFKTDKPPLYVTGKDIKNNALIVGTDEETFSNGMVLENWKLFLNLKSKILNLPVCQIRYRQNAFKLRKIYEKDNLLYVIFDKPERAVTPGQHAVFYQGDKVVGGGIIKNPL